MKIGGSFTETNGFVGFFDVDGDGLPDRVFRNDRGWFYDRAALVAGVPRYAGTSAELSGFPGLSHERAFSFSAGLEGYPLAFAFHLNGAFTFSEADTYLSDVNGDGLVDVVDGSEIYFNRLDGTAPRFLADNSAGTPLPLGPSIIAPGPVTADYSGLSAMFDRSAPPIDLVRRFRAPYRGRIRITGGVRLAARQPSGADGVRVSIEHEGSTLWTEDIGPTDLTARHPAVEVDVDALDRLHFRVHSIADGRADAVEWQPVVEYVSGIRPDVDERYAEASCRLLHTEQLSLRRVGRRHAAGDAPMRPQTADAVGRKAQPSGGPAPLPVEDAGDHGVWVMDSEAAHEVDGLLGGAIRRRLRAWQLDVEVAHESAMPAQGQVCLMLAPIDGDDDLVEQRAQQFLPVAVGYRRRRPDAIKVVTKRQDRGARR